MKSYLIRILFISIGAAFIFYNPALANGWSAVKMGSVADQRNCPIVLNDSGWVAFSGTWQSGFGNVIYGVDGPGTFKKIVIGGCVKGINNAGQVTIGHTGNQANASPFFTGPKGVGVTAVGNIAGYDDTNIAGINNSGQMLLSAYNKSTFATTIYITGPNAIHPS